MLSLRIDMYYLIGILYLILGFSLVIGLGFFIMKDRFIDFYLDDGEDWLE